MSELDSADKTGEGKGGAPIAIVGIGCRFPGGVDSPESFWRLLANGVDAVGEIPADRMDLETLYDPRPATPGRIVSRRGGYLEGLDQFDADFFGISPRQAARLDPQHRLLLETAWEALEDAGLDANALNGTGVGVFVGQWQSDFERRLFADAEGVDFRMTTGSGRYASSGRLSYTFGFNGPSLTIDTACSSSLAAVLVACRSIRVGESSMALAGGVNVILEPHITVAYSQSRLMAEDGRCKFGDEKADGYVRSEGCAMIALRPLADAIAAGDRIYAVIRGGALNNDGRMSGSLGTPSRDGQRALLQRAYLDAGVEPSRVRYVEAHGAGTRAGDPVEFDALGAELGDGRNADSRLLVGSVKTNIGHTEGAAGMAGLIKVALSLQKGAIPASLHLHNPSPAIRWEALPIDVPRTLVEWPKGRGARVAGVSGFGITGSNGHIVVEEAPMQTQNAAARDDVVRSYALPLSARSSDALAELAGEYARLLSANDAPALRDLCASAMRLRTSLPHRAVFVADDAAAMIDRLTRFAGGDRDAAQAVGQAADDAPTRVGFVFPGQGAQWIGMGRELMSREPVFRDAIAACEAAMRPYADWSLREQLLADAGSSASRMNDIGVIQPVLLAVEIALAALWRSWGIEPAAVIGHSMGEVGAAFVAGALTLDDAMRVICARSALMRRTSGQGAMGMIDLSPEDAERRIAPWAGRLSVAVHNAPTSTVVSGEPAALREFLAGAEADGIFCRQVKVDVASHSQQMDPLVPELVAQIATIQPRAASMDVYSTVTGDSVEGASLDAAHWGRNLRERVRFATAIDAATAAGVDCMIELSPHPVLVPAMQQTSASARRSTVVTGSLRREEPEQASMLSALGALWVSGYAVKWPLAMPGAWRRAALPTYPWQRQRHWHPAANLVTGGVESRASRRDQPSDESLGWLHTLRWIDAPIANSATLATGSWIVVSDDEPARDALAKALRTRGGDVRTTPLASVNEALAGMSAATALVVIAPDAHGADFLPVSIAQSLLPTAPTTPHRVWFVTRGAQSVAEHERVNVLHGALWGAARVVAEEHPEIWGGLIDVDSLSAGTSADAVADSLVAGDGEDQIAIRDGQRRALRLTALDSSESTAAQPRWRPDASYLITGGLGEIALKIAASVVDAGARRLVLLGRTALPPRGEWNSVSPDSSIGQRISGVRALEAKGASVHLITADVSDAAQLAAALDAYASEAWPPIRGVVHAAGALDNRLVSAMDRATFDRVVGPKLGGAVHLDRLLPDVELFVMFSSTGGFLAQPGQANYAAANAGLDALARDRRARGRHALSIAWGIWADTGLVRSSSAARNVDEMRRQGVQPFAADAGVALFGWLLHRPESMVTVLPANWVEFRAARAGRNLKLFSEQIAGVGTSGESTGGLTMLLAQARSTAERRQLVEQAVRDAAGRVLRLPAARLDARRSFGSMGLDSLMALELRNRLEALFARSLSATLLWNYPTVDALTTLLADDANGNTVAPTPDTRPDSVADDEIGALSISLGDLADMSDDDVARALRGNR